MRIINYADISIEHTLYHICGVLQEWEPGASWNFIGAPRPKQGFMYICGGAVSIEYPSGERARFTKGNLLYIPRGCEYMIRFEKDGENCTDLLVNFALRDKREELCFADRIVCIMEETPAHIVSDLQHICENSRSTRAVYLKNTSRFCNFLDRLADHESRKQLDAEIKRNVAPAIFYLNKHVESNVSVTELAKMCCLCETSFRRAFKSHTGMSPSQYRMHAKIEKAKMLLASSPEISITEVSNILGFFDAPHFCKVFTAVVGETPSQYRHEV